MSLIITDAGIAAAIRAGDLGIEYKITHISIGSEGYVPEPAQTELRNELQKKAITRGALVAPGQLHFETVWDGVEEFEGKELGYWLEDGTLFAVDSRDGDIITYKRKNTVVTEACELNLSASTISNITVELLGSPYATETVAGIAKVVTSEQVETGTNDSAFLTVKKFLYALDVTQVIDKLVNNLWLKLAARIFPVGAAIPWYTDTAPSGFAMMKGQAFNKATYPQLAAVFPTGVLPDMRGRAAVGKLDGETVGAFERGEIKSHNHSGSVTSTDLGTKTTSTNWHDHNLKTNTNPWGDAFAASWIGDNNWLMQGFKGAIGNIATQYANARNSIDSEAHNHTVAIGAHGHGLAINANGGSRNTVDNIKVNWIVRLA